MKKLSLLLFVVFAVAQFCFSQTPDLYLGLTPPGYTPEVFAPDIVSLSTRNERVVTFSASGHEIFFQTGSWPATTVNYIQYKDGAWTSPEIATFSANRPVGEPFFSVDGIRIYYYAYQPGASTNSEIYYSEKSGDVWGEPISVGDVINSTGDQYHPCIVSDGSLYFSDGLGRAYRSQFNGGVYENEVALPANVNGGSYVWFDHYVAPTESYMVFGAEKNEGMGGTDLYISFRNADGSWTDPQNFGNTINTAANEFAPDITPDGKYMTYDSNNDIYWVAVENTIEELRATSGVTSIDTDTKTQGFQIFPNPTNDKINISLNEISNKNISIEIIDISGKLIYSETYNNFSETVIDLTGNAKGIYFLRIISTDEIVNKKFSLL